MTGQLKLDRLLTDAHRAELKTFIASPGTRCQDVWDWLKERGYHVGLNAVTHYVARERPAKPKAFRASKLEQVLTAEDRRAVEAMAADPTTTATSMHKHV